MVGMWDATPMYSFGYIVPFVSAYLFWSRRSALAHISPQPALSIGVPVVVLGLGFLFGGSLGAIQVAEQMAFLIALCGAVLILFGARFFKQIRVALAYLLLMVPFWDAFTEPLHLPFQRFSADLGVQMLQFVGIPAYHEGVMLYLPNITLEVARACSGVNYLVAVLALGVPLGYLYLPDLWRRVVLIVSAVVIAAVSNSLRVALIGLLSYWEIGSPLHGPLHVLHGLFVSGIGYVVLFVGLRLLTPSGTASAGVDGSPSPCVTSPPWRSFSLGLASVLIGLFLLAGVLPGLYSVKPVPLAHALDDVPSQLDGWSSEGSPSDIPTWWPGADSELRRRYAASGSTPVEVSVAYFARQRQGKKLVSYRADVLHHAATSLGGVFGRAGTGDVNLVRLRARGREQIGIFWYEIDGRVISGKYAAKLTTFWNSVVHRRGNGMVVVLLVDRVPGRTEESQIDSLRDLAVKVHEALRSVVGP